MKKHKGQSARVEIEAQDGSGRKAFESSSAKFEGMIAMLRSEEAAGMTHGRLESRLHSDGMDLLRQLLQDHLDLRADREEQLSSVAGSDGQVRTHHRAGRTTDLMTIFGPVRPRRRAYEGRGMSQLSPADAALNLPKDTYSHGLERRIAVEVSKNSYDEAVEAIDENTAGHVPKRQAEEIAKRAAADFDEFYEQRKGLKPSEEADIIALSFDGKGVVVRPEDLREATRKKAENAEPKLRTRLAPGEKKDRKRMACVAAVYAIAPFVRTAEEVLRELEPVKAVEKRPRPRPENKRVWASLKEPPEAVMTAAFEEALARDPTHKLHWAALVDGNEDQIHLLLAYRELKGIELTIVMDVIHVCEYLWKAALAFHGESNRAAEEWVQARLLRILRGEASQVAAGMRRSATKRRLSRKRRGPIDKCANYLLNHKDFLKYDEYLAAGLPISTGVIEGACRHLVKDRTDVPGQWSLEGAEAVLKLRALRCSHDFDAYWTHHEQRELERNHLRLYRGRKPPYPGSTGAKAQTSRNHLRVVKSS